MGHNHGFLESGDNFETIDVPGAEFTEAFGINDGGDIDGIFGVTGAFAASSTLTAPSPLSVRLAFLYYRPEINNAGQIVGVFGIVLPEPSSVALVSVGLTLCRFYGVAALGSLSRRSARRSAPDRK